MGRHFLYILIVAILLAGCASNKKNDDKTRNWSADRFYTEASSALAEGDYEGAIEYYELLEARYPYGHQAAQAQLDIAFAYYKYDEADSAIDALDRFIRLHPEHPQVAYAYYMKGVVNLNRNLGLLDRFIPTDSSQRDPETFQAAYDAFREVVERFPTSRYAKDAKQRAIFLHNTIARHEVHVAQYYLDRGAYLAAANRGIYVVQNYQRTPSVKDALKIMAKAYDKMELPKLAEDTRRVLELNEANFASDAYKEGEKSLLRGIWDYFGLDEN
jgi:outer membrane protein assembly factor BamD